MDQLRQLSDEFSAFQSTPEFAAQGGLVVLQEIFGVNGHIKDVCRRWSELGFDCIAPSLFDPVEKHVELGFTKDDIDRGLALKNKTTLEQSLRAIRLAVEVLQAKHERVSVIGFCWGGSLAFVSACRMPGLHRAVAYYGSEIHKHREETPLAPVMLHFGRRDRSIPPEKIDDIRETQGKYPIFVYEADHGFNNDRKESFDAPASRLAGQRTLEFLEAD